MGVVRKRAWPFIVFSGYRPPTAKQLRMDLFGANAQEKRANTTAGTTQQSPAPCGEPRSCTGCPMFGMPGHPGHADFAA